ncbi:MAG: hypothetical protein H2058_08430 [Muricauda sp.]|nr:hypothetical protein [Allomuricauda sp.]MBA4745271.1 hypothetical protein [Allomuricauda sp.]
MKKFVLTVVVATALMTACSKDDGPTNECESCTLDGGKVEVCDNGDGTWTVSAAGSTTTMDAKFFGGEDLTPKQFAESLCAAGDASL